MVIKDTLPLHPLVTFKNRETRTTTQVLNFKINQTHESASNTYVIGRDPEIYNQPEKFIPDRFLNSHVDYEGRHCELLPFGAGRMMCPALHLGMSTVQLTILVWLETTWWNKAGRYQCWGSCRPHCAPESSTHTCPNQALLQPSPNLIQMYTWLSFVQAISMNKQVQFQLCKILVCRFRNYNSIQAFAVSLIILCAINIISFSYRARYVNCITCREVM